MNTLFPFQPGALSRPRASMAFTMPEMMVSLTLFLLVIGASVAAHVFGMKMMDTTSSKIAASGDARRNISSLLAEVRSAQSLAVGNGNSTGFTNAAIDSLQKGTALQIYPSSDTNAFIRYFLDPKSKTLNRVVNGGSGPVMMASAVSNSVVFTAEDFAGNVLTNTQNNCVVGLLLEFSELGGPHRPVGPGKYYTSYRLCSKLARRGN
jgi:type II secretory pathway pseudopilin PulG